MNGGQISVKKDERVKNQSQVRLALDNGLILLVANLS